MPRERVQRSVPLPPRTELTCGLQDGVASRETTISPSKIIHTQRSLFFSHDHTRFVLCLRKGIYLWKRAISKTLRSAEWLKSAAWYKQKNLKKMLDLSERAEQRIKNHTQLLYVGENLVLLKSYKILPKTNHPTYQPTRKT